MVFSSLKAGITAESLGFTAASELKASPLI
jgi:hypothetical protein